MKKSLFLIFTLAGLFLISSAQAVNLNWIEHNQTVIVDNTFQLSKPNKKWDTQSDHYEDPAPVKWVRHIDGPNPQIFLRYRDNVQGQTAHAYANYVKQELMGRGITVHKTENQVVNGRNVAILHAKGGDQTYLIGVWRHRNLGFQLECRADQNIFEKFTGEFAQAIQSVKIIKESGL